MKVSLSGFRGTMFFNRSYLCELRCFRSGFVSPKFVVGFGDYLDEWVDCRSLEASSRMGFIAACLDEVADEILSVELGSVNGGFNSLYSYCLRSLFSC